MKRFLKVFFVLSLLMLALLACQKDKEKEQTEQGQTEQEQSYDYQEMLYVNNAGFNVSGDLVVMFSGEIDKKQEFNKLIEVEGLDGDISIMPFGRKIIIKGDFQKEVPYSVKVSKGIKSISGNELNALPDHLLDDAGDTINFIELSNNEFVKLPNCINAATKKLRKISAFNNALEDISNIDFTKMSNLEDKLT